MKLEPRPGSVSTSTCVPSAIISPTNVNSPSKTSRKSRSPCPAPSLTRLRPPAGSMAAAPPYLVEPFSSPDNHTAGDGSHLKRFELFQAIPELVAREAEEFGGRLLDAVGLGHGLPDERQLDLFY